MVACKSPAEVRSPAPLTPRPSCRRIVEAAVATAVVLASGCGATNGNERAECPATKPGGPRPPRYALLNFGNPITTASNKDLYGNGTLWTTISPGWSVRDPRTGMLAIKLPWFRARPGLVTITGRPLHGSSARFAAGVGTPAEYGRTGFAASGLAFGRSGCWRLHAHLGGRVLSLVLYVPSPHVRSRGAD